MTPKVEDDTVGVHKVSYFSVISDEIFAMKYGYARVSTTHQDLQSQLEQLEKEGCEQIFKDNFTGTKRDRPEFNKVMDILKKGDTLHS